MRPGAALSSLSAMSFPLTRPGHGTTAPPVAASLVKRRTRPTTEREQSDGGTLRALSTAASRTRSRVHPVCPACCGVPGGQAIRLAVASPLI
jgi:hypothetical protein